MLDGDVALREQPGDVEEQLPGHDHGSLVVDLGVEPRSKRELHVGRGEVEPPVLRPQQHSEQHLNSGARRHGAGHDTELRVQLVARAGELQTGADHCVYLDHLFKTLCS
jgi:hypothetical protein